MRMRSVASRIVSGMMHRALKRAFRRVCWVGEWPVLPEGVPLILYANHHGFFDGYLMWLLTERWLRRPALTWMEDWDRFPFFAASGALPFPSGDLRRRTATLRYTQKAFRRQPNSILVYFPEGRLRSPDEGVLPLDPAALRKLAGLLPTAQWWPVAMHVSWWGESLPTALMTGGAVHAAPDGREEERLYELLHRLRSGPPECSRPLLEGKLSPQESWSFRFAARLCERLFCPRTGR